MLDTIPVSLLTRAGNSATKPFIDGQSVHHRPRFIRGREVLNIVSWRRPTSQPGLDPVTVSGRRQVAHRPVLTTNLKGLASTPF